MREIKVFHDEGQIEVTVIAEFESNIGYKLPKHYKELISNHNRLYPENCNFDFINKSLNQLSSSDITFLGFGDEVSESANIANAQWHDIYGREHIVVFGKTAGGDYVCFDYRDNLMTDNPPVVVMYHDNFDDDGKMLVCAVAKDFEEFINLLYSD